MQMARGKTTRTRSGKPVTAEPATTTPGGKEEVKGDKDEEEEEEEGEGEGDDEVEEVKSGGDKQDDSLPDFSSMLASDNVTPAEKAMLRAVLASLSNNSKRLAELDVRQEDLDARTAKLAVAQSKPVGCKTLSWMHDSELDLDKADAAVQL